MNAQHSTPRRVTRILGPAVLALMLATPLHGQADDAPPAAAGANGRREVEPGMVKIAWDEITVPETLGWIAEQTGKVVMPVNLMTLKTKKISLQTDAAIERAEALDMLFQAFRLNSVGVIERDDVVIIGMIEEIKMVREMPVVTSQTNIMDRQDRGSLIVKIFRLTEVPAEEVGEQLTDIIPSYATMTVDPNSNQIVVMGDIALLQHLQELITELDHRYIEPRTATFRLAYADAQQIADNILDLFETSATGGTSRQNARTTRRPTPTARGSRAQASSGDSTVGPEIELRVTVSAQQNSVTVTGDPTVVDEIAKLIDEEWDLPRSSGTSRIYTLHYTDPLKVAEKLNSLLGGGSSSGGANRGGTRTGSGQGGGVDQILQGIYSIEAYPDTSQLLVFCKTEQSLDFLDQFIADMDQPSTIGLPFVTELKHANAVELAEELNALLSEPGAGVSIERPGEGLSGRQEGDEGGGAQGTGDSGSAGQLDFPWQRGGRARDDQSPESSLIGKVRIVPIVRQNALAVLCPAPQREAVQELIQYFDRPGRQVMISAVIAEIALTDDLNLGIRISNSDEILGGANPDNRLGGTFDITGERGSDRSVLPNLFDTAMLDAALPVRAVIQALQQDTNVRILQEPVIFTADNQEALFFDGQDIPFITSTVINSEGNPTDSFEYREVGVTLNVRPRITVERDVDLEILLEISSIVPGVTLFGGAVIDRRESRTHVVVNNGQTIIISGILREEESKITRKVPLLGDIPIVGELFKSRENSTTTTELLAFVTPLVVDNPYENDSNFNSGARERLEELSQPVEVQIKERRENPDKYRRQFLPYRDRLPQPLESTGQRATEEQGEEQEEKDDQ